MSSSCDQIIVLQLITGGGHFHHKMVVRSQVIKKPEIRLNLLLVYDISVIIFKLLHYSTEFLQFQAAGCYT